MPTLKSDGRDEQEDTGKDGGASVAMAAAAMDVVEELAVENSQRQIHG